METITTPNLSLSAMTVYETLQKLSDDNKSCRASYNNITQKSGYGKTTVHKAVNELEWKQWIIKKQRKGESGGIINNEYELLKE
jgi:predicted transcriptional regulator